MVDDDDDDESPSPEPRTDSRSAFPREIRAWRQLRVVKRDETFSLIFSPTIGIYSIGFRASGATRWVQPTLAPQERGRALVGCAHTGAPLR